VLMLVEFYRSYFHGYVFVVCVPLHLGMISAGKEDLSTIIDAFLVVG
jgi:hypothetical protein